MTEEQPDYDEIYDEIVLRLDACRTVRELEDFAEWLRATGVLREDGCTYPGRRGPIAPWSVPEGAMELFDDGRDALYRLASGEIARWDGRGKKWEEG